MADEKVGWNVFKWVWANRGEILEYLMPTELDAKKIAFDPTSPNRVVLLMANMRSARIVRVELLD